jgi:Bacterial membrane protein YfhO
VCLFASVWVATQMIESRQRQVFLASLLVLGCMVEPLILMSKWWPGTAKSGARFSVPGQATRYVQQFPPEQNRVYYRANLGIDETSDNPRVDVLNQPAMFGIQNAGGYEQLLMQRYSRALGDVDYDAVRPLPGHEYSQELFQSKSHVLDLLNVTQVVAFDDLMRRPAPATVVEHDGYQFTGDDLIPELKAGTATFATEATGDTLVVVTSLANSVDLPQDTPVAELRIHTNEGQVLTRSLLAGTDTSEWAWERPDVRASIKHGRAPLFDSRPGNPANTFSSHRYWTHVPLGGRRNINRIEITNSNQAVTLALWKLTVYDSQTRTSIPISSSPLDPQRWQLEADFDGVIVLRNTRALPRAWLVAEVQPTDAETALKQIRGVENQSFDPKRTALVEVAAGAVPQLTGGDLSVTGKTRISIYEPRRLVIETDAPTASFLVTSEIFYPGWKAIVDGRPAPIFLTNYLLRGVLLPSGSHRVEMVYRSPAARNGAIISSCTLLLLFGLVILAGRDSVRRRTSDHHEA